MESTINSLTLEKIEAELGFRGIIIAGSKSGYRNRYPDNFPIFNSNLCTESGKVWYGDIDVTNSKDLLCKIAKDSNTDLYLLYEMDARFENEKSPILTKAAFTFHKDGTFSIREDLVQYVHNSITNDSKHRV